VQTNVSFAKFPTAGSGEPAAHCNTEAHAPEPTSPRRTLWLARHIYWCKLDSKIIVLDLAKDKYLGFGKSVVQTLAATVRGWPEPNTHEPPQQGRISADEASRIIRDLIAQGVLTPRETDGRDATPTQLNSSAPHIALDNNVPRDRGIRWGDVVKFLAACLSTVWLLRWRSLQNAVEAVATRKAGDGCDREFDAALAADLVAIFRRLRSFAFTSNRRCLFHALVLVNFLSRYGVYPHFVMGVKVDPWAAHSWVQSGEYVLDGTPEQVRFFTPILVA
jgi:hypothetical protein